MNSRMTVRWSGVVRLFCLVLVLTHGGAAGGVRAEQAWTEPVMEALPLQTSPGELEELSLAVWDERDERGRSVWSVSDYHLLADVSIDALAAVLRDNDGNLGRLPNLLEYEWRLVSVDGPERVIEERQETGFRFLGISATYDTSLRSVSVDQRDATPRRFRLRFEMLASHDGKLRHTEGWYFLEERIVDGRPMTYFRQWTLLHIDRSFPLLPAILRSFTYGTTEDVLQALIAAARER